MSANDTTAGVTIFALSSAPGRAGVAVFRVSGASSSQAVTALAGGVLPQARRAALRTFRDPVSGGELDRGLVLWFPAPHSFTGEEMAEFHCHGGRAVVLAMRAALASVANCRPAEPGEFARRAFENGKLDLAEAEGLADLIDAETEAQRRQAVAQAGGALSKVYEGWRADVIQAQALVEAGIDFSDEGDVAAGVMAQARDIVTPLRDAIGAHLDDGHRGEILRDGFQVVLAGAPNAGKSSLLNALARRDAAIVSEEAGTTRDVIDVRLDLGGYPVVVTDTAGLRETESAVEREGIRRTRARIDDADLVVHVRAGDVAEAYDPIAADAAASMPVLVVWTKADVAAAPAGEGIDLSVSAMTGVGLGALVSELARRAEVAIAGGGCEGGGPAITQARHREHLEAAAGALDAFLGGGAEDAELRAEDLRVAAGHIGRITGRIDVEDVLDQVFGRFCIGK